jgi:hypothetical protein
MPPAVFFAGQGCLVSFLFPSRQEQTKGSLRNILRKTSHPELQDSRQQTHYYLSTMADSASTRSSSSSSSSSSGSSSSTSSHSYSSPTRTPLGRVDSSTHVFPAKPSWPKIKRDVGSKQRPSDGLQGFPATRCTKTNQLFNGLDWVLEVITEPKSK